MLTIHCYKGIVGNLVKQKCKNREKNTTGKEQFLKEQFFNKKKKTKKIKKLSGLNSNYINSRPSSRLNKICLFKII